MTHSLSMFDSISPTLALIGSLALSELVVIVAVALMVFGGRLPEVAMRAAAQVLRARKVVTKMWRDAGLEQELRRVQWDIERKLPRESDYELRYPGSKQLETKSTHHPEEGHEHLSGGERSIDAEPRAAEPPDAQSSAESAHASDPTEDERLDPAIGFGAPAGTVAVERGPRASEAPHGPDADGELDERPDRT